MSIRNFPDRFLPILVIARGWSSRGSVALARLHVRFRPDRFSHPKVAMPRRRAADSQGQSPAAPLPGGRSTFAPIVPGSRGTRSAYKSSRVLVVRQPLARLTRVRRPTCPGVLFDQAVIVKKTSQSLNWLINVPGWIRGFQCDRRIRTVEAPAVNPERDSVVANIDCLPSRLTHLVGHVTAACFALVLPFHHVMDALLTRRRGECQDCMKNHA
ncbi:hypothetical protein VT03_17030 [Planctomyces sp. SH-PL14]|nr:hypothetical protein VT03_17030 [Planctomyces sp. SH-PL14]